MITSESDIIHFIIEGIIYLFIYFMCRGMWYNHMDPTVMGYGNDRLELGNQKQSKKIL